MTSILERDWLKKMSYSDIYILSLETIYSSMSGIKILLSFLCGIVLEFDRNGVDSVDCLWQYSHFFSIDPTNP